MGVKKNVEQLCNFVVDNVYSGLYPLIEMRDSRPFLKFSSFSVEITREKGDCVYIKVDNGSDFSTLKRKAVIVKESASWPPLIILDLRVRHDGCSMQFIDAFDEFLKQLNDMSISYLFTQDIDARFLACPHLTRKESHTTMGHGMGAFYVKDGNIMASNGAVIPWRDTLTITDIKRGIENFDDSMATPEIMIRRVEDLIDQVMRFCRD
jgi:hypothetical protein